MISVFLLSGWYMTGRQESQRDMASVNIKTRRRPSVPCGTWTGESSVVGLSVLTTLPVRKTRKSSKVSVCFKLCVWFDWHMFVQSYSSVLFLSHIGLGTGAPIIESPYGDTIQPQEAPESISRAVASLPPEQMFELMKQMKVGWFISAPSCVGLVWYRSNLPIISFLVVILNWHQTQPEYCQTSSVPVEQLKIGL